MPGIFVERDNRPLLTLFRNGTVEFHSRVPTDDLAGQWLCEVLDMDEIEFTRLPGSNYFFNIHPMTDEQWVLLRLRSE